LPEVGLEGGVAAPGGRVRVDRYGLALSAGGEQVESDRPPDVQPDQRQLGRRAPGELRDGAELHPHDAVPDGFPMSRLAGYQGLPQGAESQAEREGVGATAAAPRVAPMELHDLAA